jgi:hypothetical protein
MNWELLKVIDYANEMHVTMLVQAMMHAMGDGGVHDITSPSSNKSHKE